MAENESSRTPWIVFTMYSPYMAVNLGDFKNSKGENLEAAPVVSLCRCGQSSRMPYCDGTHSKIGFVGEKEPGREPDRTVEYEGKDITILYNRGVCAANGACVKGLPDVFKDEEPWRPDSTSASEIIRTIEKCPSGALSYKVGGTRYERSDRSPAVKVAKNGPLEVVGGIVLHDDKGNTPECREHYTLCRCGGSDNRPFCDGTHLENDFRDDEN
ncbi:MAG: CDGSH iron-sulfur domain-containing protein [Candidatus Hydrothermarchaeaceae archaeon]